MKRAHGHLAFALVAAALSVLTAGEAMHLEHTQQINMSVTEWSAAPAPGSHAAPANPRAATAATTNPQAAVSPDTNSQAAASPTTGSEAPASLATDSKASANPTTASSKWFAGTAVDHLSPEARLARAVALSRFDYDAALAAYKAIIQSPREDLHRIALYDLGNLNLRQAVQYGLADEAQSLPLTELAKQSYRDLLRRDPTDWDARYNLERALRLAPEEDDDTGEDTGPPDPREHERTTIADPRMDLP
jgi:tetratricopeptide (TPR) repeat protein